jgi:hypothetical protein
VLLLVFGFFIVASLVTSAIPEDGQEIEVTPPELGRLGIVLLLATLSFRGSLVAARIAAYLAILGGLMGVFFGLNAASMPAMVLLLSSGIAYLGCALLLLVMKPVKEFIRHQGNTRSSDHS